MRIEELIGQEPCRCVIAGHVNPDGDCCGTTNALYLYIKKNMPNVTPALYLEEPRASLMFLPAMAEAHFEKPDPALAPDLLITVDVSSMERLGQVREIFPNAAQTLCIDHHESNAGLADVNVIVPDSASCAEVLFELLDPAKMDAQIAECLFTGIVHDTGVFQYENTQPETLRRAAALMELGADANAIIDNSFNVRTYPETRALGYALNTSRLHLDGRVITSFLKLADLEAIGASRKELDHIVSQLRYVQDAEVAVFLYEVDPGVFKASLRSADTFDVSRLAGGFGGGGHKLAAGCTMNGPAEEATAQLLAAIRKEWEGC